MLRKISLIGSGLVIVAMIILSRRANGMITRPAALEKQDVYYSFVEGRRISEGVNPYERIFEGDMSENKKYATYFPLFYELSFISQKLGLSEFETWIDFWGNLFRWFEYGIGILIYLSMAKEKMEWGGVFAAGFWLFNRWTLRMIQLVNFDFIPIFFMLAALALFPRKKWLSLFLFSVSLGFKQIGIFIAPLFVIWTYLAAKDRREQIQHSLASIVMIASVPLLSSIPFLLWNAEGLIKSVLFSAMRTAASAYPGRSMDAILGWEGLPARIPMLLLMFGIYLFAFKGNGKKYAAVVLISAIFISFNSVLYEGYMTWFFALVPLLISEQYVRITAQVDGQVS